VLLEPELISIHVQINERIQGFFYYPCKFFFRTHVFSLQNGLNLHLDRHQLFSLETIVVFLVGGSDVLELPVEILLLHDLRSVIPKCLRL